MPNYIHIYSRDMEAKNEGALGVSDRKGNRTLVD
jgi:hypothetical protein